VAAPLSLWRVTWDKFSGLGIRLGRGEQPGAEEVQVPAEIRWWDQQGNLA